MQGIYAFIQVLKTLPSLNKREFSMLLRQRLKGNLLPNEWLASFSKLRKLEKSLPAASRFLKKLMQFLLPMILLALVLLFTAHWVIEQDISEILLNTLYGFLCFLLLIYLLHWFLSEIKITSRFSDFIFPLVLILKEEAYRDAAIELDANLKEDDDQAHYFQKTKNYKRSLLSYFLKSLLYLYFVLLCILFFTSQFGLFIEKINEGLHFLIFFGAFMLGLLLVFINNYFAPKYPRIQTKMYQNPWLSFRLKLADRGLIQAQITSHFFKIKVVKKNPRGKIKTKYKSKSVESYKLKVNLPTHTYEWNEKSKPLSSAYEVQKMLGDRRNQIIQKGKIKAKNTSRQPKIEYLLKMLGNAYQQVKKNNVHG